MMNLQAIIGTSRLGTIYGNIATVLQIQKNMKMDLVSVKVR